MDVGYAIIDPDATRTLVGEDSSSKWIEYFDEKILRY